MTRILGVDPGAVITGYGVIDHLSHESRLVVYGTLRLGRACLPERLGKILEGLRSVIAVHTPDQVAIEEVFVSNNVKSALILGHARGAAICAAVDAKLPVHEYSTRTAKQTVVGYGAADKAQIQHMIKRLLSIQEAVPIDAADALAIAICHAHHLDTAHRLARVTQALGT